jgi:hypothetical protein
MRRFLGFRPDSTVPLRHYREIVSITATKQKHIKIVLGSEPTNLRHSAWKNARYQWFGFRRKGWLPLQGIHGPKDESVHFSMPVTPKGCQQNDMPLAWRVRQILPQPALYTLEIENYSYGQMPGLEQNLAN